MNNDAQDILDELQSAINDMHADRMRMAQENSELRQRIAFLDAEKRRIAVLAGLEPSDPSPQPYVALEAVRQAPATAGEEKL